MTDPLLRSAMVALRAPELPSLQALLKAHADTFAEASPGPLEASETTSTLSLAGADAWFTVTLVPTPLPWSELAGPCETAWHWPQASKRMKAASAHLVVTASSATLDAIDLTLRLTRMVAAAALATPSVGIYWGGAMQVHNVKDFVREAQKASRTQLPLYLWLRFGLVREDDGSTSLYTTGMTELDLMEVEFPQARLEPQTVVDRAFNIAHYLLERGPVLEDGHTIGVVPDEKLVVRHAPSMLDSNRKVYSLSVHAV